MILHCRDLAYGGVQETLVGLIISMDRLKDIAAMDNDFSRGERFTIGLMTVAFGEADDVPREAKSNDLTPTVVEDPRQAKNARNDLIYGVRRITFAEKMRAGTLVFPVR